MKILFLVKYLCLFANALDPITIPIFLKNGYSSVVEFEEVPLRAVLGDSHSFQIEKIEKSLVIRPLVKEANSNLFVYFKNSSPRLLILTANDSANPTFFKKFESFKRESPAKVDTLKKVEVSPRQSQVIKYYFDKKKDFLTVDFVLVADSRSKIAPKWENVYLKTKNETIISNKIWSERKEVQKDTFIKARVSFIRPNISKKIDMAVLEVPTSGTLLRLPLNKGKLK